MVFRVRSGRRKPCGFFTGAPVPVGCDTILIQENAREEAGLVEPLEPVARGRNIRAKGVDFTEARFCLLLERGLAHRTSASPPR